jgi:hypothetical protein
MKMDKEILMQILLMQNPQLAPILELMSKETAPVAKKAKRKVSAYSRRYGAAYKRLRKRHTLKNGKYRKGYNHKRLVKLAHKEAKRGGK